PRSRPGARVPQPAAHPRAHPRGSAAPGDTRLRDSLHHAAAGAVRGARGGQDAGRGGGAVGARPRVPPPGPRRLSQRAARRAGLLLVAPALALLAAVTAYPALWVLWLSLQRRIPIFDIAQFEGAGNYLFLAADPRFWSAVRITLTFTVISVLLELGLGLLVALALVGQRRGRRLALSLLLLAWALPGVVTAKLFEWLYNPTAGLVNYVLLGAQFNWLGDPALALPGLIAADVWRTMPLVALLCYARLLIIPAEIYEASRVDGAGGLATFLG